MFKKKKKQLRMTKVFIPGGFPKITYIARKEKQLEDRVASAQDYLAKLIVVTGATKSGKTVLVDRVFPQDSAVWVDGGAISDENSFWELVVEKANLFTEKECIEQDTQLSAVEVEGSVEGNIFVAKGSATTKGTVGVENISGKNLRRSVTPKVAAVSMLQSSEIPLIVDDFHYIDKKIQKSIVRALKAPIMHGLPVVFIAIPNRKYDAVEVEREMTGRIENIEMPIWEEDELKSIAVQGFSALNVRVRLSLINRLSWSAYGSPFLMQEFCRSLCEKCEIEEYREGEQYISDNIDVAEIFVEIAEHSGRSIFNKLKRGPRARSDRKKRLLKSGEQTDIYGVVMEGFKELKPGVESMPYELLRNNIREVLSETPPKKNEISRVLDQIAKISYTDTSSTPVIDWQRDDNMITITDPFFAFFLKWAK
jgi:hypothetical protein